MNFSESQSLTTKNQQECTCVLDVHYVWINRLNSWVQVEQNSENDSPVCVYSANSVIQRD